MARPGKAQIYSNIYNLDLNDKHQMNMLFGLPSALIVFYDGRSVAQRTRVQRIAMKVSAEIISRQPCALPRPRVSPLCCARVLLECLL